MGSLVETTHRWRDMARLGVAAALVGAMPYLGGCGATSVSGEPRTGPQQAAPLIAVFPVENLSGKRAPLTDVQSLFVERLRGKGFRVLDDAMLERVVTKHRVRYQGGLEQGFGRALKEETGVEALLIPSLEVYDDTSPPRAALFARLVSTGDVPGVRWIDGRGAAGDDAPGILGIGLVDDPRVLVARSVDALVESLDRHVSGVAGRVADRPPARKFGPKIVYRSDTLDPTRTYSVAVLPFFNKSTRKYAGEILALHMIRSLMTFPALEVVEPGIVREELLRFRIIMSDGVSLPQTETILGAVNADLVLNGEVLDYRDPRDPTGTPTVDFAVLFIERKTARIVYSSYSHSVGNDGVYFFDVGRVNTAHAMAAQMARAVGARMLLRPSGVPAPVGRRG